MPAYSWFRCSSDRKVVVGAADGSGSYLFEGVPPQTKIASPGSFSHGTFSVSPNGSQVAYFTDRSPLCVVSPPRTAQCANVHVALPNAASVDDSGQLLFTVSTPQQCFYKTASNFSAQRFAGATDADSDACLAIGYWKPDLKSSEIVEPIGRNPEWITPETARLLRDWAMRTAIVRKTN